jgi:hypothetical protein
VPHQNRQVHEIVRSHPKSEVPGRVYEAYELAFLLLFSKSFDGQ